MTESTSGTPRERRRERTRVLILQTAEQLLAEGGLQKLTLAELAHRAAYSKPAIYEYFSGIEDILIELTNTGFVRLGEQVQTVSEVLPPDERLRAIANTILQFATDNVELYQLMFTHIIFSPGRFDQRWAEARGDTQLSYRIASQVIQQGIDQNIFKTRPDFDHKAMVYMCWVVVHGMASLKSGLVREVGLNMPYNHELVLSFLINNLKGILPDGNARPS
jgi:AcrR family transcriptional regulator